MFKSNDVFQSLFLLKRTKLMHFKMLNGILTVPQNRGHLPTFSIGHQKRQKQPFDPKFN